MNGLVLTGCAPEPLIGYLTGLGVLRLLAEQVDPETEGWWSAAGFHVSGSMDREELFEFFLDGYVPTPLVSPWNKGSGLRRDGKSPKAERLLAAIETSTEPRLEPYRRTIAAARRISDGYPDAKELETSKDEVIRRARSELPDEALPWIDAAVVLTDSGPVYPHLLGTGGNLGRLDLTANAFSHLLAVFDTSSGTSRQRSRNWLEGALFGLERASRVKASTGQYDPGHAGGVNQASDDNAEALVNPWGYLLALEGAVLLASGAARRLSQSHGDSVAAMPFTVRPANVGASHLSDGEQPKGELWLPLWGRPTRLPELRRLFAEGRLQWGRRHATTALDAVRAVTSLGAERGLDAFTRTVIVERLGQNPLAIPAGRVRVQHRQAAVLTGRLDEWTRSLRRRTPLPTSLASSLRRFEQATFDTAAGADDTTALQELLVAAAELDRRVSANRGLRGQLRPLPPLEADEWLPLLDDGSPEFVVAAALASLHEPPEDPRRGHPGSVPTTGWRPALRDYLRPVAVAGSSLVWSEGTGMPSSPAQLVATLAYVHAQHATRPRPSADEDQQSRGHDIRFARGLPVDRRIGEAFAAGVLDDRRIAHLLTALILLRPVTTSWRPTARAVPPAVVPAWRLLVPLFHANSLRLATRERTRELDLRPRQHWPAALRQGGARTVLKEAASRYRVVGLEPRADPARLGRGVADGPRLAAALMLHLSRGDLTWLLTRVTDLELATGEDDSPQPQEVDA